MGRPTRPRRPLCVRWPRPRAFSPGWCSKGHRTGSKRTGRVSLHRGLGGWAVLGARKIDFTKPRVRAIRVDRTGESIEQHEPGLALVVGASEPHQCGCASEERLLGETGLLRLARLVHRTVELVEGGLRVLRSLEQEPSESDARNLGFGRLRMALLQLLVEPSRA